MRIFAHVNHVLRGYSHLTHEAIVFRKGEAHNVPDAVGSMLIGAHPYEFCQMPDGETEAEHLRQCWLLRTSVFPTTEMETPPVDRQMEPIRHRGRPRKLVEARK